MVYMVEVLPLPVGPTIKMVPLGRPMRYSYCSSCLPSTPMPSRLRKAEFLSSTRMTHFSP